MIAEEREDSEDAEAIMNEKHRKGKEKSSVSMDSSKKTIDEISVADEEVDHSQSAVSDDESTVRIPTGQQTKESGELTLLEVEALGDMARESAVNSMLRYASNALILYDVGGKGKSRTCHSRSKRRLCPVSFDSSGC